MQFHRAVGGYIEMYSQGLAAMRAGIEQFLVPRSVPKARSHRLFPILFAGMTAKPLADVFFGMATVAAELDDVELTIRNVLRADWEHHTSFRNDLAHAEWHVGWEYMSGQPAPVSAVRIKSAGGVPTLTDMGIDTNDIIAEIDLLIPLVEKVRVFAEGCRRKQLGGDDDSIKIAFILIEPSGAERRKVTLASWPDPRWEGR